MFLISHRGNIDGKRPEYENKPSYIINALEKGYDVEVDVWGVAGDLFLGHDRPEHRVSVEFLSNQGIWSHCKNIEALSLLEVL